MKRPILIVVVLSLCVCSAIIPQHRVNMRNMSTVSAVRVNMTTGGTYIAICTLDKSPQLGIPVDSFFVFMVTDTFNWWVTRLIDTAGIGSGRIYLDSDKWLLIEGDSSGWTCTWSDEPW